MPPPAPARRGSRLTELLKQPDNNEMKMEGRSA